MAKVIMMVLAMVGIGWNILTIKYVHDNPVSLDPEGKKAALFNRLEDMRCQISMYCTIGSRRCDLELNGYTSADAAAGIGMDEDNNFWIRCYQDTIHTIILRPDGKKIQCQNNNIPVSLGHLDKIFFRWPDGREEQFTFRLI